MTRKKWANQSEPRGQKALTKSVKLFLVRILGAFGYVRTDWDKSLVNRFFVDESFLHLHQLRHGTRVVPPACYTGVQAHSCSHAHHLRKVKQKWCGIGLG
jgi:hypothetical protein